MASTLVFYIARHGKTLMNTLDKVQGWCDSPLTEEGIKVAEYLGKGFKDISFDAAYCSDLRRTRQTAQTVLKAKGQPDLPVTEMFGFREACFGSYEAGFNHRMWGDAALYMHYTRLEDMYNDIFSGKASHSDTLDAINKLDRMGIAESFAQVEERAQSALKEIAAKESADGQDKTILVIAHGMSIICLLHNLGGKDLLKGALDNAAVCKVTYTAGKFTVHTMGDMSYVNKGKELAGVEQ